MLVGTDVFHVCLILITKSVLTSTKINSGLNFVLILKLEAQSKSRIIATQKSHFASLHIYSAVDEAGWELISWRFTYFVLRISQSKLINVRNFMYFFMYVFVSMKLTLGLIYALISLRNAKISFCPILTSERSEWGRLRICATFCLNFSPGHKMLFENK